MSAPPMPLPGEVSAEAPVEAPAEMPPLPVLKDGDLAKLPPPPGFGKPGKTPTARKSKSKSQLPGVPKSVLLLMVLLIVGLVGGGGWFLYISFFEFDEPEPLILTPVARPAAPATTAGTEPAPAAPTEPQSTAGALVQAGRDAAAAQGGRIDDDLFDAREPAGAPAAGDSAEPVSGVEVTAGPRVVIVDSSQLEEVAAVEPSVAFQQWVSDARISGVREGSDQRAFINGRLVKQSEVVDHSLQISFDRVDAERNFVIFRDSTGAEVAKRY